MPESSSIRKDATLAGAVEVARRAAEQVARPGHVGEPVAFRMDAERLGTHLFECTDPGYVGWAWAVSLARVPRGRQVSVCEVDLVPSDGALLAPEWVPWEQRLRPGDFGRSDQLPYKAVDERLDSGFEDTGEDPDLPEIKEMGLGRARVLSAEGIEQAVNRWYGSEQGPGAGRVPKHTCSTCGFLMKMSGTIRTLFGVCANEWAQDDGRVVSLDHACGAHSETDAPKQGSEWIVRPSRIDDGAMEAEALDASHPAPDGSEGLAGAAHTQAPPEDAPEGARDQSVASTD
ncbi:DUF3027 domain-containing protein [Schaalia sp. 19OD2882]|uniref:DUF3027 domain-containing protein n=1 Tax=Schaalia sp. 19OD2882 TaxID=2794089 RepID=UPI001C1ED56C|nr:DUF3027 domain-containing protein [Schaalia sp. 19OD2882]QWW19929.1 DUF3027 domain-containing protein [Schaalia sp. 19OD2882]